jgi:hypothetical protein
VLTSLKKKEVGYDDVVSEIATFLLSIIGLDMDISQNYIVYQTKPTRLVSYLITKLTLLYLIDILRFLFTSVHDIILDAKILLKD